MPKAASTKVSKRATKAKQVPIIAIVSPDGDIQGTFTPEPRRPLIAHFPFRSTEVQFQDGPLVYDPRPPTEAEPYDACADDLYTSNAEPLGDLDAKPSTQAEPTDTMAETATVIAQPSVEEKPLKAFRTIDIMLDYRAANETNSLPQNTSAACFWCAGGFDGRPIVIPTQEENKIYTVYGNFCTLPCSLSYLLNEHLDPQVRWERQALLHRMYSQTAPVQPAPPRESLRFFGGTLTHDQYRDIITKKQIRIDSHLPPVISILATLDTKPIDFYETSLRNTSTNVDYVKPLEPGLRLKRSKPLKDKESTLDTVMNLNVKIRV